jgi:hypothetical protein
MLFAELTAAVGKLNSATPAQAVDIVADLFEKADFGDAGLIMALCGDKKPGWQSWRVSPWLAGLEPDPVLVPVRLPEPHTLVRVYKHMQFLRKAKKQALLSRRHMLETSLAPADFSLMEQFVAGKVLTNVKIMEAALAAMPWRPGLPVLPEKLRCRNGDELEKVWQNLGAGYGHVKDDGGYCQIHKQDDQVLIFEGVRLFETTGLWPNIVRAVQDQVKAGAVVLEGELVGLDAAGRVVRQTQMQQARHYQVRLFDLMGLNGEDVRALPYKQRHELRRQWVSNQPSTDLCHAVEFPLDSLPMLQDRFEQCLAENWEGMVVKKHDAIYRSGAHNPHCVKLKQTEPVDATIVGCFLNQDGRALAFLLALYNEKTGCYETCARTRQGLSDKQVAQVQALVTETMGRDPLVKVMPREEPDVWVRPVYVFEFEADYREASSRYFCGQADTGQGWTLRSPRFISPEPRQEKAAHHTTSIEDFLEIRVDSGQTKSSKTKPKAKKKQHDSGEQLSFLD